MCKVETEQLLPVKFWHSCSSRKLVGIVREWLSNQRPLHEVRIKFRIGNPNRINVSTADALKINKHSFAEVGTDFRVEDGSWREDIVVALNPVRFGCPPGQ